MKNEAGGVDVLMGRLFPVLEGLGADWEIVCVNDGSTDDTLRRLLDFRVKNPKLKILDLTRNFGKEIALTAGLDHATGDAVIIMDADLQHPPELIPEMIRKWQEDFDAVVAIRRKRLGENRFRQIAAKNFYRLANSICDVPITDGAGDFRLLSRKVVDAVRLLPERNRFMKGLFSWVGFRQTFLAYDQELRHSGSSAWSYGKLWNFALDGLIGFSSLPLKIWGYIGSLIAMASLGHGIYLLIKTMVFGVNVPGYASIVVALLFLGGIQLLSLGVLGEYLARVYDEVKGRPLYLVRDRHGISLPGNP